MQARTNAVTKKTTKSQIGQLLVRFFVEFLHASFRVQTHWPALVNSNLACSDELFACRTVSSAYPTTSRTACTANGVQDRRSSPPRQ